MTDGPIVPFSTGSCALLPVARSVSSKVLPVFSVMYAAAFLVGEVCAAHRRGNLHGPCAESRRAAWLLAGSTRASRHDLEQLAGLRLALGYMAFRSRS